MEKSKRLIQRNNMRTGRRRHVRHTLTLVKSPASLSRSAPLGRAEARKGSKPVGLPSRLVHANPAPKDPTTSSSNPSTVSGMPPAASAAAAASKAALPVESAPGQVEPPAGYWIPLIHCRDEDIFDAGFRPASPPSFQSCSSSLPAPSRPRCCTRATHDPAGTQCALSITVCFANSVPDCECTKAALAQHQAGKPEPASGNTSDPLRTSTLAWLRTTTWSARSAIDSLTPSSTRTCECRQLP